MDRELVKGVLVNALNNAYLYTHDKIHIAASQQGKLLELRVEDNGRGYPERLLQQGDHAIAADETGPAGHQYRSLVAHWSPEAMFTALR